MLRVMASSDPLNKMILWVLHGAPLATTKILIGTAPNGAIRASEHSACLRASVFPREVHGVLRAA